MDMNAILFRPTRKMRWDIRSRLSRCVDKGGQRHTCNIAILDYIRHYSADSWNDADSLRHCRTQSRSYVDSGIATPLRPVSAGRVSSQTDNSFNLVAAASVKEA
jgi:hypothetical protein